MEGRGEGRKEGERGRKGGGEKEGGRMGGKERECKSNKGCLMPIHVVYTCTCTCMYES